MAFASETSVPVEKTRGEIERLIVSKHKYHAGRMHEQVAVWRGDVSALRLFEFKE